MPALDPAHSCFVAIVGAGPAGLMAAEVLSGAGVAVQVYDAMPSAGRKFLLAGRGGLNLTHSEPLADFMDRYGERAAAVADWLHDFGPAALRDWADGLGGATFVGTSGRVFPREMKAAPLLRAWLQRLRRPQAPGATPVRFHMRHRWAGWGRADTTPDGAAPGAGAHGVGRRLVFETPAGRLGVAPAAVLLALGGASWPRLGSDGAWLPWLQQMGAELAPLAPANCGFDAVGRAGAGWTPFFAERFAGEPLKSVAVAFTDGRGRRFARQGEFVVTATGVEGSLIYAFSGLLRDEIARAGQASFMLDLLPGRTAAQVQAAVAHPRGSRSLSSHLKSRLGLGGVKMALLHELLAPESLHDAAALARAIKALPLTLVAARPVAEAISTAGGVRLESLTDDLELRGAPGVFCAGEMLDWEAPTGGYLLTASLASGVRAARGVLRRLGTSPTARR
ncbi:MAG TPA: TIGR03862 family flavoprotein [Ottowia sp.]|uniref:TIGR03862 family flavoprotein n=1 Tax=Ottowia sp. TaxID=1898956 RepID=UPI002C1CBF3B|nr:TIGR03862 family flavoprotein [Ottowia sp.]HMN22243.1 TIGR03862 family flavoprotein [Ottowia sp.]